MPRLPLLLATGLAIAAICDPATRALAAKPLPGAGTAATLAAVAPPSAKPAAARTTASSSPAAPSVCPPPGFDSAADFDMANFIASGPWYAAEQNEVFYQPRDTLFCVRAAYVPRDPKGDLSKGVAVINTANRGSVNGPSMGSAGGGFMGIVAFPDTASPEAKANPKTQASKLRVLPSFLEVAFRAKPSAPLISGPYWVVASSGPDLSKPGSWAVISGGAPTNKGAEGTDTCRTGRAGPQTFLDINGSGLWLFTKEADAGAATVAAARNAAANLGFDTSSLLSVVHKGCAYPPVA